jgi:Raf kinase inhibitor-like YbhB/YbcL family protein
MRYLATLISAFVLFFMSLSVYADDFAITTNAFLDTGALPVLYTCDGKDISPELSWSNLPKNTQSLVVVVSDPDAPGGTFYHWLVYNIPATTTELAEGIQQLPTGAMMGTNSFNKKQYNGPCPPKGSAHTYLYTLYALDTKLKLPAGVDGKTLIENIQDHTLQQVKLTAVYSRWLV